MIFAQILGDHKKMEEEGDIDSKERYQVTHHLVDFQDPQFQNIIRAINKPELKLDPIFKEGRSDDLSLALLFQNINDKNPDLIEN